MGKFQFAGRVAGRSVGAVNRYGTKDSGMVTTVGGWEGMVRTRVWYDDVSESDKFEVMLIPHWDDSGTEVLLAEGILNHKIEEPYIVPAIFA